MEGRDQRISFGVTKAGVLIGAVLSVMGTNEFVIIHKVPSQVVFRLLASVVIDPEFVPSGRISVELGVMAEANKFKSASTLSSENCVVARQSVVVPGVLKVLPLCVNPEAMASMRVTVIRGNKMASPLVTLALSNVVSTVIMGAANQVRSFLEVPDHEVGSHIIGVVPPELVFSLRVSVVRGLVVDVAMAVMVSFHLKRFIKKNLGLRYEC
jgi:hypothetical protein